MNRNWGNLHVRNDHRGGVLALLLSALAGCFGCEAQEAQQLKNAEQVQAKLKRGREEGEKAIANAKATKGSASVSAKKGGTP
jgi:hypothetical protein